jgi:prepilin-type N-terminal cleavage/methylation domain-containing protein
MTRRSGFSLIELMAVMIILGAFLMAVVPALDGLVPSYRLKGAAREIATAMEQAQSEAVGNRREYQLAYDLDTDTYWLVLPPKRKDEDREEADKTPEELAREEALKKQDDLEHGLPPKDPDAPQDEEQATTDVEREALTPKGLPTDVVFVSVVVGDDEKSGGEIRVPFTYLGTDGSHVVGLKLENGEEGDQLWVKFNAITRTIEYHEQRPQARTTSGGDD